MSARREAGTTRTSTRGFFTSHAVRQDERAKSLSFYSTEAVVSVDREIVRQLVELSSRDRRGRARLCLHAAPESLFHEMVVVERRGDYFRPHKHLTKGESCVILEGRAAFFVFDDDGAVTHASVIGPDGGLLARVEADRWHVVMPLSPYAVYLESKPGPFLSVNDSLYPAWAPDGSDPEAAGRYMETLVKRVASGAPAA
jgi:cupin fold WbuC family metalloprotein